MAQSISNIAVIVNGETVQLQSAMQQAAQSMDTVSRASKRLNADMMEQRRVFRAMNPAITDNDKAMDRLVQKQMRITELWRDLDDVDRHAGQSLQNVAKGTNDVAQSMSRVQGVAQQGVFAIDDFVAGFSTGGIAGGIRGAANNISMMAMMLGTLKTQLIAIGGLAVIQLGIGLFKREEAERIASVTKEVNSLTRSYDELVKSADRFLDIQFKIQDINKIADTQGVAGEEIADQREQAKLAARIAAETKNIADEELKMRDARRERAKTHFFGDVDERVRMLEDDLRKRRENLTVMNEEFAELQRITKAIQDRKLAVEQLERAETERTMRLQALQQMEDVNIEMQKMQQEMQRIARTGLDELDKRLQSVLNPKEFAIQEILRQVEEDIKRVNEAAATGVIDESEAMRRLQAIGDAAAKQMRAMNPADMSAFGRLPSAMTMGSPGSVSSINQSIAGSMNLRDSTRALRAAEKSERHLEQIEKAITKGQENILAVVPL